MAVHSFFRDALRRQVNTLRQMRQRRDLSVKTKPPSPTKPARSEDQIPTPNNVPTLPFWQRLGPLTRAAEAYARAQRKRPYTTQLCSSLVIYLCSDLSAQSMGPRDYDPLRTVRSLIIGGLSAIPSYNWFMWLSHSFNYPSRLLSLATKVVVNQVCFTPVFNTYFFGMHALLAGENMAAVWERIKRTVPTSVVNSCKLWPAVTAFSFTFIPIEYRSLFGGFIAVGWQTYLSFLNRLAEEGAAKAALAGPESSKTQLSAGPAPRLLPTMAAPLLRARPSLPIAFRPLTRPQFATRSHLRPGNTTPRRPASTTTTAVPPSPSPSGRRFPFATLIVLGVLSPVVYLYTTDTRASLLHQYIVPPLIRLVCPDAEDAHHVGTDALKALYSFGLHPRERLFSGYNKHPNSSPLGLNVFGTRLASPLAISAGLDKDAEIPDALFALGASVVEVGGCTLLPQDGNPKPRVFRIPSVDGLINRYGLNSRGADAMASRLRDRRRRLLRSQGLTEEDLEERTDLPPGSLLPGRLLLVQMAKNKETDERDLNAVKRDYVGCVQRLAPYADVLVVNVSSPNTPGLRDLQATGPLTDLLSAVVDEAQRTQRKQKPRVMVKVSPDEEDDSQIEGVVQAVWMSGVDGVIVGNTTKRRDVVPAGVKLRSKEVSALREVGGFSGPAMFGRTLSLVGRYRKMLDSYSLKGAGAEDAANTQKVIFATGGITTGEQALQVLNAGASVAMVYTGMVYGGSGTITRMKQEMIKALEKSEKTA
ncbi:hypothetical protein QBC39DRAFT_269553 [Podospora conica]|nr:hypothetical protein QBC39DRAFT_269553 [Schizothecium conicum]